MSDKSFQELKKIQDTQLERMQKEHPELFEREKDPIESEINDAISIDALPGGRERGYIRLYPHDVIVEEVDVRGKKVDIHKKKNQALEGEHTRCVLVKGALSHYEAQQNIAKALNVHLEDVSYAEPKDTHALTFSPVTIKNKTPKDVEGKEIDGVILKTCERTQKPIEPRSLGGNVFTIFVRTEKKIDQEWLYSRVSEMHVDGCVNFFDAKKFGGLRLLIHKLGAYVVRGEYQRAITELLFNESEYDIDLLRNVRREAKEADPDINAQIALFEQYPILFRVELDFLKYLKQNPGDYQGALKANQKHVSNWIFAYQAYLFNAYVSGLRKKGIKPPKNIPLMFAGGKDAIQLYDLWIKKHSTDEFWRFGKDFLKTVMRARKKRPSRLYPDFLKAVSIDSGVILQFSLPRDANPQVVLMNMFETYESDPVPGWVSDEKIDVLATLQQGSVSEYAEALGTYLDRSEQ